MHKTLFFVLSLFITTIGFAQNTYFPQVFFNKKQAQEMIGLGNSTIEGVASTKQRAGVFKIKPLLGKKHFAPKGTVVMLFPVTPYFEEWYKLRKSEENNKTQVLMSEEAFKYRIEALTDDYGRFKFEKIKPGKYYLETIVNFTATGSYGQQTGSTDTYINGAYQYSTPIYSTFFYNYQASNRESKFVEIEKDGQLVEIKL